MKLKKILCFVLLATILIIMIFHHNVDKVKLQTKKEVFIVELGEAVSLKASTYLKENCKERIKNDSTVTLKHMSNEKYVVNKEEQTITTKDKEYLEVGKYDFTMKYKKETKDFIVEVKDTTPPIFKKTSGNERGGHITITLEQNSEGVVFENFFELDDLSKDRLSVVALLVPPAGLPNEYITPDRIERLKIGNYQVDVYAKDKYDNEILIIVGLKVIPAEETEFFRQNVS